MEFQTFTICTVQHPPDSQSVLYSLSSLGISPYQPAKLISQSSVSKDSGCPFFIKFVKNIHKSNVIQYYKIQKPSCMLWNINNLIAQLCSTVVTQACN